jgi:tetratricopeptide (TPR) repeat protein
MFYKKTSTNYNKWDMFESSEEEEETDPIVPKDDP